MIDEYLNFPAWQLPEEKLTFTKKTSEILETIEKKIEYISNSKTDLLALVKEFHSLNDKDKKKEELKKEIEKELEPYNELFIYTPAFVSCVINYNVDESEEAKIEKEDLILTKNFIKNVFKLNFKTATEQLKKIKADYPTDLMNTYHKHVPNPWVWEGTNPQSIKLLANSIKKNGVIPDVIICAAHGGISAGTLTALYLESPAKEIDTYFLRYTKFEKEQPELEYTKRDRDNLENLCKDKNIIVLDEASCTGKTLNVLKGFMTDFTAGRNIKTAAVICEYSSIGIDFVGKQHNSFA